MKKQRKEPESFGEHLDEVRFRLFGIMIALAAGSAVGYSLHDEIVAVLLKPIDTPLYYTNPAGGFEFLLKVSLTFGLLLALPVVCYNIIRFVEPMMRRPSKRFISLLVFSSILLAVGGAAFAYVISLPAALHFLTSVGVESVSPLFSTKEYFNFVLVYLAGFAALFQVPLLLIIVNKITPLKPMKLFKNQKFIILISFIVAAILTPTPDPINQTIMAAPAIVMYQFGIVAVAISNRRPQRALYSDDELLPELSSKEYLELKKELAKAGAKRIIDPAPVRSAPQAPLRSAKAVQSTGRPLEAPKPSPAVNNSHQPVSKIAVPKRFTPTSSQTAARRSIDSVKGHENKTAAKRLAGQLQPSSATIQLG